MRNILTKKEALDFRRNHPELRLNSSRWEGDGLYWVECNFYNGKGDAILRGKVWCDSEKDALGFLIDLRG